MKLLLSTQCIKLISSCILDEENILDSSSIFLTQSNPIVVGIDGYKDLTSAVKIIDVEGNDRVVIICSADDDEWHIVGSNGRSGFKILLMYNDV